MSLFTQTGANLHGHFRLTSGLHSAEYLQCAKVLAFPEFAESLGQQIFLCICPLCGGACQVQRTRGLRMGENWYCGTCSLSLQRRWM